MRGFGGIGGVRPNRAPAHQLDQRIDKGDHSTMLPAAIVNCGIHSGVASAPCEMSWNVYDCHTRRTLKYAIAPARNTAVA